MAGHPVFFLPDLSQAGDFFPASGELGAEAARVELAAGGGMDGARDFSFQKDVLAAR